MESSIQHQSISAKKEPLSLNEGAKTLLKKKAYTKPAYLSQLNA